MMSNRHRVCAAVFGICLAPLFAQPVALPDQNESSQPSFNGSPIRVTEYAGSSLGSLKRKRLLYFSEGKLARERSFGDDGKIRSETLYIYTNDLLSEIRGLDGQGQLKWKYRYFYDDKGRPIREESLGAGSNIDWYKLTRYTDGESQVIETETVSSDGLPTAREMLIYDEEGRISEFITKYGDGQTLKRSEYVWHDADRLEQQNLYDSSVLYENVQFVYDEQGQMTEKVSKNTAGKTKLITRYAYTASGELAMTEVIDENGETRSLRRCYYDEHNNRVWIKDNDNYTLFDIIYGED